MSADAVAARFNRLMKCILEGDLQVNSFQPWEIAILLDVQGCTLPYADRRRTLQRYQRHANRRLADGTPLPPTLTEYLTHCRLRSALRPPRLQAANVSERHGPAAHQG